ncbi:MAG TPA: immunoglobulin domain-containing protein, partial [Oceanipulchritudo sp.]|nr:immunoglobulin domain-containing protein [Oceanipulchritudo sp.]
VGAVYALLSIERITTDPETDTAGSFIVDAAFLNAPATTELPLFTVVPEATQIVNVGQTVTLDISISSPTPVTYHWYHDGQQIGTGQDLAFTADPAASGTYFVVVTNAAGPIIGAITEVTVLAPDSDGDRISDYDETVIYGTNPNLRDTDHDGINDYDEIFVLRTDPLDPASAFKITNFAVVGNTVEITFQSVLEVTYRLEGSPDLSGWQTIGSQIHASGNSTTVSETVPVTSPALRFFRIVSP